MVSVHLRRLCGGILVLLAGAAFLAASFAHESPTGARVERVFSAELPNVPGKSITAVRVMYEPGQSSPAHRHAGTVLAYVLAGSVRSQNSATGPERVYRAGEAFFEPEGSTHLVSANASDSEPASLLAIFIADTGAQLTTVD